MVEVSDDARIYGNVYGGGDIANVGETAAKPDYTSVPSSVTAQANMLFFVESLGHNEGAPQARSKFQIAVCAADFWFKCILDERKSPTVSHCQASEKRKTVSDSL